MRSAVDCVANNVLDPRRGRQKTRRCGSAASCKQGASVTDSCNDAKPSSMHSVSTQTLPVICSWDGPRLLEPVCVCSRAGVNLSGTGLRRRSAIGNLRLQE